MTCSTCGGEMTLTACPDGQPGCLVAHLECRACANPGAVTIGPWPPPHPHAARLDRLERGFAALVATWQPQNHERVEELRAEVMRVVREIAAEQGGGA